MAYDFSKHSDEYLERLLDSSKDQLAYGFDLQIGVSRPSRRVIAARIAAMEAELDTREARRAAIAGAAGCAL